jgi:MerR family transcriptional regulator, copper efflux regulator
MTQSARRHLTVAPGYPLGPGDVCEPALVSSPGGDYSGELLQVGDLAKAVGKTVRALHLYETMGLIEPERRSKGRYRLFAPATKVRIRWISKLQSLGLSLSEIQAIVQKRHASVSAQRAAEELRQVYSAKLAEVRQQLHQLRALELELEASLVFLDDCHSSCENDAHLGCTSCRHFNSTDPQPTDLILGPQLG